MKSEQHRIKEVAELVFEQNEFHEIYNTKNRYDGKWIRPVNKEIVDTLLNTVKFKVAFIDGNGELYVNF